MTYEECIMKLKITTKGTQQPEKELPFATDIAMIEIFFEGDRSIAFVVEPLKAKLIKYDLYDKVKDCLEYLEAIVTMEKLIEKREG